MLWNLTSNLLLFVVLLNYTIAVSASQRINSIKQFFQSIKSQNKIVTTLTVGPDFVKAGQSQTITLLPPFQNHYTKTNPSQTVADLGGFLGVERKVHEKLILQLGVSAYGNSQITAKGTVWQFARPEFESLSYAYHIQHARVMFTNKILTAFRNYQKIYPYFLWEVGTSYNNTKGYQEYPLYQREFP